MKPKLPPPRPVSAPASVAEASTLPVPEPLAPTTQYDDAHESYDDSDTDEITPLAPTSAAALAGEDPDDAGEDGADDASTLPPGTLHPDAVPRVRLDVWLWAARLFRTRGLAKAAIESGRVRVDGARTKVAKLVEPGMMVFAPQGWESIEVLVRQCADNRRGAPEARLLYEETPASTLEHARRAELRQAQPGFDARPGRDDRRQRAGFKREGYRSLPG